MKKILSLVACLGFMALGLAQSASAFSDHILLNHQLTGDNSTFTWQHSLPSGFSQATDTVTNATLTINAAVNGIDILFAEHSLIGALVGANVWDYSTNAFTTNGINIKNIFAAIDVGDKLDLSAIAFGKSLTLLDSTLTFDFTQGSGGTGGGGGGGGTAPVPEPATLLLLGSGLSGLALWGKRRKKA